MFIASRRKFDFFKPIYGRQKNIALLRSWVLWLACGAINIPPLRGLEPSQAVGLLPRNPKPSLLIQNPQAIVAGVRLHSRLIHQFRARRRDAKLAGHLDAHGIL